jgi:hypothetical protein
MLGSVRASITAETPVTHPGTSQAASNSGQAGGRSHVSHNLPADLSSIREDTLGDTSGAANVHSCGSSTATTEGHLFCPDIQELVHLVNTSLLRMLENPAVMGDARQPAAWMPDKTSIINSCIQQQMRVFMS